MRQDDFAGATVSEWAAPAEVSHRSTRHGCQHHFPKVRLEAGRMSFSYFGSKLYNNYLPQSLKLYTIGGFKKEMLFDDNRFV